MLFNPSLVVVARQSRQLSQTGLAKKMSLNQGHLSKIENGQISPSKDIVEKLSSVLEYPSGFFYQGEQIIGLPMSVHPPKHRKKANVSQRDLEYVHAKTNIRMIHIKKLLQSVDVEAEYPLPHLDPEEYDDDIERIASLLRKTWLIPPGPINNLTAAVEKAGVIVILCDLEGIAIDGLSIFRHGYPAFIFLNKSQPADRMRFTIAHELGHLVMHRTPSPNMEQQANDFASAFLMPKDDIKKYFTSKINLPLLASMKKVWKISMAAIAMRAKTLGVITKDQSTYLWKSISQHGYRLHEPANLDFEYDFPTTLPEILKAHIDQLHYDVAGLSSILELHEHEFRKMYSFQNTGGKFILRAV